MADVKDRLSKGLSETRTVVLGAQILFGFQYEAVFAARFKDLAPWAKTLHISAFAAMLAALVVVIAPTPFHRISEGGRATPRQTSLISLAMMGTLVLFGLAVGASVAVATSVVLQPWAAGGLGAAATAAAAFSWFGVELMQKRPPRERTPQTPQDLALKEKIAQLLTEARLVLPGVQALLGFQFTAYLTEAFGKLDRFSQGVHTASLILLLSAMVLLMTPAPYHRLGERGEDTPRAERVSQIMVIAALVPLAAALGADFYVAVRMVSGSAAVAGWSAATAVAAAALLWFAFPVAGRVARKAAEGG